MPTLLNEKNRPTVIPEDVISLMLYNEDIPLNLDEYGNLKYILFSNVPIEELPFALVQLSTISTLEQVVIRLYEDYKLPKEIGLLNSLRKLELQGVTFIPEEIRNCENLTKIVIHESIFDHPPEVLNKVKSLRQVKLEPKNFRILNTKTNINKQWAKNSKDKILTCCKIAAAYAYKFNVVLNGMMRKGIVPQYLLHVYNALIEGQVDISGAIDDQLSCKLYRGINRQFLSNLEVGDIIYDNAFMSFSFSSLQASKFSDKLDPIIIELDYTGKGIYLSAISRFSYEEEFVIGPQKTLRIETIEKGYISTNPEEPYTFKSYTKIKVSEVESEPLQELVISDKLEREIMDILTRHPTIKNTTTNTVYNTQEILDLIDKEKKFNIDVDIAIGHIRNTLVY